MNTTMQMTPSGQAEIVLPEQPAPGAASKRLDEARAQRRTKEQKVMLEYAGDPAVRTVHERVLRIGGLEPGCMKDFVMLRAGSTLRQGQALDEFLAAVRHLAAVEKAEIERLKKVSKRVNTKVSTEGNEGNEGGKGASRGEAEARSGEMTQGTKGTKA